MARYLGINGLPKHESENLKLGQVGFDKVPQAVGTTSGKFVSVFNPEDSEVTVVLVSNIGDNYTGKLPPNGTIYGNFKSVRCSTSGKEIIATRRPYY